MYRICKMSWRFARAFTWANQQICCRPSCLPSDIVIPAKTNTLYTTRALCMTLYISAITRCSWCLAEGKGLARFSAMKFMWAVLLFSTIGLSSASFFFGIPLICFLPGTFIWRTDAAAPCAWLQAARWASHQRPPSDPSFWSPVTSIF